MLYIDFSVNRGVDCEMCWWALKLSKMIRKVWKVIFSSFNNPGEMEWSLVNKVKEGCWEPAYSCVSILLSIEKKIASVLGLQVDTA